MVRCALGIDVGSTTAKIVALDEDDRVLESACVRHRGRPRETVLTLVARARAELDVTVAGVTGSIGVALADELDATPLHEVRAVTLAVRRFAPTTRTVIELGGQDAKLVLFGERPTEDDAQMNDRCAAGTGATIDRIARRLALDSSALAALRLTGSLRVASRCGVFAETDVVNLVKRGATHGEVLSALARAIVLSNLAVLARGRVARPPVVLLGGPHAHLAILAQAWREALGSLWRERGVAPGAVEVPRYAELHGAIGAALHARGGGSPLPSIGRVLAGARVRGPLRAHDLHALRPSSAPSFTATQARVEVDVGIDAGSTTAKVVLLAPDGAVIGSEYRASAGNPVDDARTCLAELEARARDAGVALEVRSLGVTGYGAELVAAALGADVTPVETLAHAAGARSVMPDADVIVDVGGTDAKVVLLDRAGRITGFHLSTQCSAGQGAFLASTAEDLGVPLTDYARAALSAKRAPLFAVGCSVFVDTDRVTFQRDGFQADEILAGLAHALVRTLWEYVVPDPVERLGRRFVLTGGAHKNLALAVAQSEYLAAHIRNARIAVHPYPELSGAIGAALEARAARPAASRFVGLRAARRVRVTVRSGEDTRCTRCDVECARSILSLERAELVVGNACERGADAASSRPRTRAHAPDLLAEEAARLFRPLLPRLDVARKDLVLGIPRVMALYRAAPLLLSYLRAAGVPEENLVLSPPTSAALFQSGARRGVHDPCFPAKLVLAHVEWLLRAHRERPLDALVLPTVTHARIAVTGTADTASCPIVAACGHTTLAALRREGDVLGALGVRALTPELCLADPERLDAQLFDAFGALLGLDLDAHRRALDHATRAQVAFLERCRRRGAKVLERARERGHAVALVLARPYHADPGVQHGVSTELAARGLPVMGLCSLPLADCDLSSVLSEATNSGAAERVWAARRIAGDPHLVPVELSSFRCGHDASVAKFVDDVLRDADRPMLRLHDLDEHRPGASMRLRLDTFVETVRRYEHSLAGAP